LYNIIIAFSTATKLVKPIKMCLIDTYGKVHISKNMLDAYPIQNGLKEGEALLPSAPGLC
jgi:hypothetical protein